MLRLQQLKDQLTAFLLQNAVYIFILLTILIIAYGYTAFNYTVAGDEWVVLQRDNAQDGFAIRIGRWLLRVTYELLGDNYPSPVFTTTIFVCGLVCSGWVLYKIFSFQSHTALFLSTAIFAVAPTWSEAMSFDYQHVGVGIGMVAGSLLGYTVKYVIYYMWGERNLQKAVVYFLSSLLAFMTAAGSQQSYIFFGLMMYLVWLASQLIMTETMTIRYVFKALFSLSIIVVICLAVYYAIVFQLAELSDLPINQGGKYSLTTYITSWQDLQFTLGRLGEYVYQYLFMPAYLFPILPKAIFLVVLALTLVNGALLTFKQSGSLLTKLSRYGLALFLLALMFITPWTIGIVNLENAYRYNGIVGTATFYSSIFLLGIALTRRLSWSRLFYLVSGFIITLIFAFQLNMASLMTQLNNNRDLSIATRVLYQLESHPNYPRLIASEDDAEWVIIGRSDVEKGRSFEPPTTPRPMNRAINSTNAFNANWSRIGAVLHLYQYDDRFSTLKVEHNLRLRTTGDIDGVLADWVMEMPNFPAYGSVIITDDLRYIIVKLNDAKAGDASQRWDTDE